MTSFSAEQTSVRGSVDNKFSVIASLASSGIAIHPVHTTDRLAIHVFVCMPFDAGDARLKGYKVRVPLLGPGRCRG